MLCSLEISTPDLSEMESNAQKELKEMTAKLKQLQNEIKIVSLLRLLVFLFQRFCHVISK